MKRNWELSSSNLRICLNLFKSYGFQINTSVVQFQWLEIEGRFYLYNTRSEVILAAVRRVDGRLFIRYRSKSRYRNIIEKWAEAQGGVSLPSNHVGRWERRMRTLRDPSRTTRARAIQYYAKTLRLPEEMYLSDGLDRKYNSSHPVIRITRATNTPRSDGYGWIGGLDTIVNSTAGVADWAPETLPEISEEN